jgi:methyl-accepting chemotaxis protein
MVEESTAASLSLASEAERLRSLVDRFRIPREGNPAAALRSVARSMAEPAVPARRRPAMATSGNAAAAQDWQEF